MATIKGKWKWNATLSTAPTEDIGAFDMEAVYRVNFKANEVQYIGLYFWGDTTWNAEINGMSWKSCYFYATSSECNATWFAEGLDYNISTDEDLRVMDFGSEEQYIDDALYEYIISNSIEVQPYVNFLYNVNMTRNLTIYGDTQINGALHNQTSEVLSDSAVAFGVQSQAGIKGFYWNKSDTLVDPFNSDNGWIILWLTSDFYQQNPNWVTNEVIYSSFPLGSVLTVHAGSKYNKKFIVNIPEDAGSTSAVGSTLYLKPLEGTIAEWTKIFTENNEYSEGMHFTDNAVFCPDLPQNGVVDFGKYAFVTGEESKAINYAATVSGRKNEAYGQYATAFGRENSVGYAGFAAGRNNTVSGESAAALNQGNIVSGKHSFAGGYYSEATEQNTFAFGQQAKATSPHAIALGLHNEASASCAFAEGKETHAGYCAHSEGEGTYALGAHQHVQGKFNARDDNGIYAHIIGGGHADNDRKNIHTIDWYGNAWYSGDLVANNISLSNVKAIADTAIVKPALSYLNTAGTDDDRNEGGALGLGAHQTARYGAALGWGCQATGDHGMAFGTYALAKGGQMALGKANDPEASYLVDNNLTPLLMVGNGDVDGSGAYRRSNAFVVTKDGKGFLGGKKILTEGGNTGIPADIIAESLTLCENNEYETALITPSEFCLQSRGSAGQMRLGPSSGLYINTGSGYCSTAAISITSLDSNYRQHTITLDPVNARIMVDDTPVLVDNTEQMYDIILSGYTSDISGKTVAFSISATIISSLNLDITKANLNTLLKNASNLTGGSLYGTGVMAQTASSGEVTVLNGFHVASGQGNSLYLSSVNKGSIYVDLNKTDVTLTGSKYRVIV